MDEENKVIEENSEINFDKPVEETINVQSESENNLEQKKIGNEASGISEDVNNSYTDEHEQVNSDFSESITNSQGNIMQNEEVSEMSKKELFAVENDQKKSKKGFYVFLIILVLVGIVAGVWYSQTKRNKTNSTETPTAEKKSSLKMSGNGLENFDLEFLKLENEEKNKVYSPLSIKYALEMLAEGAKGETKKQLDDVIGNYKSKKYTNSKNMSFANAMFIRDTFKNDVKQEYINKLKNNYNAEVIYDSFASAKNINNWISNKTFKLVDELMDDKTVKDLDYIITNALAIDMEWVNVLSNEFDVKYANEDFSYMFDPINLTGYSKLKFNDSQKEYDSIEIGAVANKYDIVKDFGEQKIRETVKDEYEKWLKDPDHEGEEIKDFDKYLDNYIGLLNDNYKKIDSSTDFSFYDDTNLKAFAKDLKTYDGTTLQYIGIMPKTVQLNEYIKNVDATKLNNIISGLKEIKLDSFEEGYITKVYGYIPIFSYDYELKLMDDLKTLGIKDVFDETKADLSSLSSKKSHIEEAVHKANIDFSNEGIKAAAVTGFGGKGDVYAGFEYFFKVPVKEINITFDKPYMYIVRDKNTGEVWFTGTVYEPASGSKILSPLGEE